MNALLALYGIVAAQPAAQRAVLLAAAAYAAKSSGKCRSAFCAAGERRAALLLKRTGYYIFLIYGIRTTACAYFRLLTVRGKASRWVAEWKLAPVDARQLYLALAAATRVSARLQPVGAACPKPSSIVLWRSMMSTNKLSLSTLPDLPDARARC